MNSDIIVSQYFDASSVCICYMLSAMGQGHEIACKMCAIVMVNVSKQSCSRFIDVKF